MESQRHFDENTVLIKTDLQPLSVFRLIVKVLVREAAAACQATLDVSTRQIL